jgi:hypothetical protein
MDTKKQTNNIGGLWEKDYPNKHYMTGVIEIPEGFKQGDKLQITVFHNDRKQGNQPDWNIVKSKEQVLTKSTSPLNREVTEHEKPKQQKSDYDELPF